MRSTIKHIKVASYCVGIFFLTLSWCAWDLTQHIKLTSSQIVNELALTRVSSTEIAKETQTKLVEQVQLLRVDSFDFLKQTSNKLDRQMDRLVDNTFVRVDRIEDHTFAQVNKITNEVSDLNHNTKQLLDTYRKPAESLNRLIEQNDIYFNCGRNDNCWAKQTANTLMQIEKSSTSLSESMSAINQKTPVIVSSLEKFSTSFANTAPQILENTNKVTKNVERLTKPRWYDRLIGWGVNGSLVYYNINRR